MTQAAIFAAPLIDEPVPELKLANGKILKEARAKTFSETTVFIQHTEGVSTIRYEDLPSEFRATLEAKRPAPKTPEQLQRETRAKQEQAQRLKAAKAAAQAAQDKIYQESILNGLRLISQTSGQNGYMELTVENINKDPVKIYRSNIVGEGTDQLTYKATHLRMGPVTSDWSFEIAGGAKVTVWANFQTPAGVSIRSVRWTGR